MDNEKHNVTYTLKELFDNQNKVITDLSKQVSSNFKWLLGFILGVAGLMLTLHFNLSAKMDKIIEKVHSNDKEIAVIKATK